MLELICQQRYKVAGLPVDMTPYRNHGTAIGTGVTLGPGVGGQAITFDAVNSAVRIPATNDGAWRPLTALKIEVDVRVPDPTVARTLCLVEGESAFRFQIFEHAIEATLFSGAGIAPTHLRAADAFAPDHGFHPVPPGRWITLGLYHDGFAKAQLTMDDRLVAETHVTGSVAGVGPSGVAIGNALDGNTPLHGAISEVRIWRLDPQAMRREFLCRPIDADDAACLAAAFDQIRQWMAAHPEEAAQLVALIHGRSAQIVRMLQLLPDKERRETHEVLDRVTALWCQGRIKGTAMEKALAAWLAVLAQAGVPNTRDEDEARIQEIALAAPFPDISLKCDPKLSSFIKHFGKAIDADQRRLV